LNPLGSSPIGVFVSANGTIYISWAEQKMTAWDLYLVKSVDSGVTFSIPVKVNSDSVDGPAMNCVPALGEGNEGQLYVAWCDPRNSKIGWHIDLYFAVSEDGGATFGPNLRINDDYAMSYQTAISMVVDSGETIHLFWSDNRNLDINGVWDYDVYHAMSTDGGQSFSANMKISDEPPGVCAATPAASGSGIDSFGNIYVAWESDCSSYMDLFASASIDGGQTYLPSVKVNDDNTTEQQWVGGLVADPVLGAHLVWADFRQSTPPYTGGVSYYSRIGINYTEGSERDIVLYEWDFTSDGIFDYIETEAIAPDGAFDGKTTHVYGDNGIYTVTLRVTDETGAADTDTCNVTVNNIAPTIENVSAYVEANITLRLAGEKWHDASMYLYENGTEVGSISIVRYPGSPDDQSGTIEGVTIDLTKEYSVKVIYTPDDDPVNGQPNGANPAWIILTFEDGTEERIHHTFNVKHPETWEWDVELNKLLVGHEVTFEASGLDPGSDDLGFEWSVLTFTNWHNNDGTTGTSSTDPYPSPDGIFPFEAADVVKCAFPGSGTILLTLWDDDGGSTSTSIMLA
jgi:hypothetical protein